MKSRHHPPRYIDSILQFILKERFADELIGDMHEWYAWQRERHGKFFTIPAYVIEVMRSLSWYKFKGPKNILLGLTDTHMLNNNIKLSIRSLIHHRLFTLINVIGLTISLLCFLFIFGYIRYETSYNNFHPKEDHIYRVLMTNPSNGFLSRPTPSPLANAFLADFEDKITFARFGQDPVYVEMKDQHFYESQFYWGDSSIFSVFDLLFKYGNPKKALTDKNTLVLTEEVATEYFGENVNPVGKLLDVKIYDGDRELVMRVDGVLKKLPSNSDLPFRILGSISNAFDLYSQFNDSWGFFWLHTYAYVPDQHDLPVIEQRFAHIAGIAQGKPADGTFSFRFQPLSEVHLYSNQIADSDTDGNINYIRIFGVIGVFILLIASINYLNLMTARINRRQKEVSIRKVLGANKGQLLGQFLTESNLTLLVSLVIAVILMGLLWPSFTELINKPIPVSIFLDWSSAAIVLIILLLCGTLSGLYPALLMLAISVARSLDGRGLQLRRSRVQKVLVTLQFTISVFLILSTLVIYRQVRFLTRSDLGFDQDQLVCLKVEDRQLQAKITTISSELEALPEAASVTVSGEALPSDMNNGGDWSWDDETRNNPPFINMVSVDEHFFSTIGTKIILGRNFPGPSEFEEGGPIIINKAAMRQMDMDNPVGLSVMINGLSHEIIGVVDDYHYESLRTGINPALYCITAPGTRLGPDNILIRLKGGHIADGIDGLKQVWGQFASEELLDYQFVDESFRRIYQSEEHFLLLFSFLAGLSIVVSCLGLYGLVLFTTEEKVKEISIRKVLGSSVAQIVMLVGKKFIPLIVSGLVIGIPAGLYFSNGWLEQYSNKVSIDPATVLLCGFLILFIAGLTIGINTVRAALVNPVNNLKE